MTSNRQANVSVILFRLGATGAPIVTGHRSSQDDIDGSTRRYRYGPVDGPPTIFWTATISTDRTFYQPEIRVIEVTEPDAARTAFAYDEGITGALRGLMAEPVTQMIDARGKPTETRMNRYGAATRVTTPAGVTTTTWDLDHLQPETELDALGGLTTFTYDDYGNTTSEVLVTPHGEKRRSWTYHPPAAFAAPHVTNRVATQTDPRGHVTELGYDPRGNLTTTSRGGVSTTNGYEANGDRRSLVDGNGKTWLFRYDAYGFPRETQSPLGHVTETAYDARGRKRAEVDANGHQTDWAYDVRDRVRLLMHPTAADGSIPMERFGRATQAQALGRNATRSAFSCPLRRVRLACRQRWAAAREGIGLQISAGPIRRPAVQAPSLALRATCPASTATDAPPSFETLPRLLVDGVIPLFG